MKNIFIYLLLFLPLCLSSQTISKKDATLLKKYYKIGIPAVNKDWTLEEYTKTAQILLDSVQMRNLSLPNNKDASFAIFKKFIEHPYLDNKTLTEEQQLTYLFALQKPCSNLLIAYLTRSKLIDKKLEFSNEITLLQINLLQCLDKLSTIILPKFQNNPNLNETQKQGLVKMKRGLNTMIEGLFIVLTDEYFQYQNAHICSLSEAFFAFYNKYKFLFDKENQTEFDKKIETLHLTHELDCVKKSAILTD